MLALLLSILGTLLATEPASESQHVRFATFNIWELSATKLTETSTDGTGSNPQLRNAAEIIQRIRPDILLINEIDFDPANQGNAQLFIDRYLKASQNGQQPIDYPFVYFEPVNTGVPTGMDLDNDGESNGPGDAYGFGKYPGQYGMALLSRFPILRDQVRTFRKLLWKDVPNNLMPDGHNGKPQWYGAEQAPILRLSSKSHWDLPIQVNDQVVHVLCAHPTPPVFDGEEDRNGRRNFDEIRLLADYVTGGDAAKYIVDDEGRHGGLAQNALFVICGDMNADANLDSAAYGKPAIDQLIRHPKITDPEPSSMGAADDASAGPPRYLERRTADFGRADYVLPSRGLTITDKGVFWPTEGDPLHKLVSNREASSDHRLVWVDVDLPKE